MKEKIYYIPEKNRLITIQKFSEETKIYVSEFEGFWTEHLLDTSDFFYIGEIE